MAKNEKVYEVETGDAKRETVEVPGHGNLVLAFVRHHNQLAELNSELESDKQELRKEAAKIREEYGADNVIFTCPTASAVVQFTTGRKALTEKLVARAEERGLKQLLVTVETIKGTLWTQLLDQAQLNGKPLRESLGDLGFKIERKTVLADDFKARWATLEPTLNTRDTALVAELADSGIAAPTVKVGASK